MDYKIAQASPATGASNADSFQPPTQNPQNIPSTVQQQEGLQENKNTQGYLNEQRGAEITVTKNPAPATTQAKSSNDAFGLILLSVFLIILAIIILKITKQPSTKSKAPSTLDVEEVKTELVETVETPEPVESSEPEPPEEPKKPDQKPATTKKTKKVQTKKKTTKKAKRKRR
jgi:hypothetical protein